MSVRACVLVCMCAVLVCMRAVLVCMRACMRICVHACVFVCRCVCLMELTLVNHVWALAQRATYVIQCWNDKDIPDTYSVVFI